MKGDHCNEGGRRIGNPEDGRVLRTFPQVKMSLSRGVSNDRERRGQRRVGCMYVCVSVCVCRRSDMCSPVHFPRVFGKKRDM